MASPPSLRISPETRSGPTVSFVPIALNHLLIVLISVVSGSPVFTLYMKNIALAAEYCRIIGVKRIGLFYLGKRKLRACFVPHFLTREQREERFTSCPDIIAMADADNIF